MGLQYVPYAGSWARCLYCGNAADSSDHVLPLSQAQARPNEPWAPDVLQIVPACRSCNSIAGPKFFPSFKEKWRYIVPRRSLQMVKAYLACVFAMRGEKARAAEDAELLREIKKIEAARKKSHGETHHQ